MQVLSIALRPPVTCELTNKKEAEAQALTKNDRQLEQVQARHQQ